MDDEKRQDFGPASAGVRGVPFPDRDLGNMTREERLRAWMQLWIEQDKDVKNQDYMSPFLPYLTLLTTSTAGPHPSATYSYTVQKLHTNRLNNMHGGAYSTLFDYATTLPLALVSKPGFWMMLGVSRTLNVTYLRPAPVGTEIIIECEITHIGQRLCSLRGVMRRAKDGEILALCDHQKFNTDKPASKV